MGSKSWAFPTRITSHGCHASAVGFEESEQTPASSPKLFGFAWRFSIAENYSRYSNDWNVVTWFKFYEGDDRYFATTNDAGVFRTLIVCTLKCSGCVYLSHGRVGLSGFLPAKRHCQDQRTAMRRVRHAGVASACRCCGRTFSLQIGSICNFRRSPSALMMSKRRNYLSTNVSYFSPPGSRRDSSENTNETLSAIGRRAQHMKQQPRWISHRWLLRGSRSTEFVTDASVHCRRSCQRRPHFVHLRRIRFEVKGQLCHTTKALPTAPQHDKPHVRLPQSVMLCESCQEQRVPFTLPPSEICR